MVGEIRDRETGQVAIHSWLKVHLLFTTVHANKVTDVIGRFINMGVEPYNFLSELNCILAQRVVRVICPNSNRPKQHSAQELTESVPDPTMWRNGHSVQGYRCLE